MYNREDKDGEHAVAEGLHERHENHQVDVTTQPLHRPSGGLKEISREHITHQGRDEEEAGVTEIQVGLSEIGGDTSFDVIPPT